MSTIFITVDALRADHLGQYGYERDTMPVLDRLVDDGTLFENAFSNAPFTHFSIPSFHTSRYIGNNAIGDRPTIASILSTEDITTCTIGTHTGSRSVNHGLGFDEYRDLGKEYYEQSGQLGDDHSKPIQWVKETLESYPVMFQIAKAAYDIPYYFTKTLSRSSDSDPLVYKSAETVTNRAINWIEQHDDEEFFLWIHYLEGHRPYGIHDPDPTYAPKVSKDKINEIWDVADEDTDKLPISDHKLLIDQYDSNLRYCSRHLDRLFDSLEELEVWNDIDVLFSSDHGEEFYDHGKYTHHNYGYDELIHVPLIFKDNENSQNTITDQRELIDLAPTITDCFNVETPSSFNGTHLLKGEERCVIARGSWEGDRGAVAVRWDGWKYIHTKEQEYLFDLEIDPLEEHNKADDFPDIRRKLLSMVPDGLQNSLPDPPEMPDNEQKREQLEALGYI